MISPINLLTRRLLIILSFFSGLTATAMSAPVATVTAPKAAETEKKLPLLEFPSLTVPYVSFLPEKLNDGIRVGNFDSANGDKNMLKSLAEEISAQKLGKYDSLLVMKGGELIFESYYLKGRVDQPHRQASVTKAILSLAIGRAIALGHLKMVDLHKPIVSFFNGLNSNQLTSGVNSITLHQALTMQSGLRVRDELLPASSVQSSHNPLQMLLSSTSPIDPTNRTFHYQSEDPALVMQVLNAVVPNGANAFIEKELFHRLGIFNYRWREGDDGLPIGAYGAQLTSRDMVKLGLLVKSEGNWQGVQLIPKAYLAKSSNKVVALKDSDIFFTGKYVKNPSYGYFWWQADMLVANMRYFTRSAQGGGGQYIVVIDDLDLIIVTTGHERNEQTMKIIATKVLPIFIANK